MSFNIDVYRKPLAYGQYTLTDKEYANIKALNYSSIKEGDKKDIEYIEFALNGQFRPKSDSLNLGKVFHCYLYEPEKFEKTYYFSESHFTPKRNKKEIEHEIVWKGGCKTRIDLYDGEKIKRMGEAILANPYCRTLVELPGKCETTLLWRHPIYDVNFKSRYDKLPDKDFIFDLKTTKGAYEKSFAYDFYKYGYDVQSAIYSDAHEVLFQEERDYVIISVSNDEPFISRIYNITRETREKARQKYHKHIENLIEYSENPDLKYQPKDL